MPKKKSSKTRIRRVGYGIKIRGRTKKIEDRQRKKQVCLFCKKPGAKRLAKGIWKCKKCGKKFASGTFYVE